ncbi:unnamed protein product [Ilex paraguariensis]|uniref:CCHC-type domain-containing protein n=1 Tax=Ilex paraguariensis TaxID=185542 RepID=A0ABC8U210_9AQUA
MGKREKKLKSKSDHESDDEALAVLDDDDDEEANEDLSLKIVEKAMLRACSTRRNDGVMEESESGVTLITDIQNDAAFDESKRSGLVVAASPSEEAHVVTNMKGSKKTKKEKLKKKNQKIESQNDTVPSDICSNFRKFCGELFAVDGTQEEDQAERGKAPVVNEFVETNPVEIADNIVLRKLLRGPRYFDPPDSGWGTCYNCGEEGHTTVNCTSAKRKRPCFVCGSLEHNAKQCAKVCDGKHE